jgi:thiol-disulfide isomerase/thioredoxin
MRPQLRLNPLNISRILSAKARTLWVISLFLIGWSSQGFGLTLKEGDFAPNWMLNDTSNQATMLYNTTSQGHRCVLVFWTTRCKSCSTLLPQINQLSKEAEFSNTVFYALNIWEGKDPSDYFFKQAPDLNLLLNADTVASRYGITTTPSIIVIDADRRISYLNMSPDKHESIQELREILTQSIHANDKNQITNNQTETR